MGGIRATYDVHFRVIEKRVADFLLVLIDLFCRGATSENRLKIGVLQGVGQYLPNFSVERDVLQKSFVRG